MLLKLPYCGGILSIVLFFDVAQAGTLEAWPPGTKNVCRTPAKDIFIDFEEGLEGIQVAGTYPEVKFTNTGGLNWLYLDARSGNYNLNGYNGDNYFVNGNKGTWLGPTGSTGRIDFTGSLASYFSVLACAGPTGIKIRAYNSSGFLLDSATAGQNTWLAKSNPRPPLHRLTVEDKTQGGNIAYIEVSDAGNFWVIDDICTDAKSPCIPLEGFSKGPSDKRLDIVLLKDEQYSGSDADFKAAVTTMINTRLFAQEPAKSKKDYFNFYTSERLKGESISGTQTCGTRTLPKDFYKLCPFADVVGVVHSETYGDCSSSKVFSTEADTVRSFIHEVSHAAFGLFDSYDGSIEPTPCSTYYGTDNYDIYLSEAACKADAAANGKNVSCIKFTPCPTGSSGRWKIDEGKKFIMDDGTHYANGWSLSSQWRMNELFDNIVKKVGAGGNEPASTTRSILMELQFGENLVLREAAQVIVSAAPQYLLPSYAYSVQVKTGTGTVLGTFGIEDPLSDGGRESGYVGGPVTGPINITLVIPYFTTAFGVAISNGDKTLNVDVSYLAGLPSGTLQADAGGPYKAKVNETITFNASASSISTFNISFYEWDIGGTGKSFDMKKFNYIMPKAPSILIHCILPHEP